MNETSPLPPTGAAEPTTAQSREAPASTSQRRALGLLAVLAALCIAWLALPVGMGLMLGTLTAFSIQPIYNLLLKHWRRPQAAALVCTGGVTVVLLGMLTGTGYFLVKRSVVLLEKSKSAFQSNGWVYKLAEDTAKELSERFNFDFQVDEFIDKIGKGIIDQFQKLTEFASAALNYAGDTVNVIFKLLLGLFFTVLSMHFVLRHWSSLTKRAQNLLPLHPKHSGVLFDELRHVGRSVLLGTVVTGLAQGILAGLGYWVTGVPEPVLFGALTAAASLIPAVGTLLLWVPLGIFLMLTGHTAWGVVLLIYGATVVVGVSDYLIRPLLVGRHGNLSQLLTFVALFGGLEAFNVPGLVLGPLLMMLAVAVLRIYERERTQKPILF